MFDPSIGRWLEEDPLGFEAGDSNLYRYVGNNPTAKSDPSGLAGEVVVLGGGAARAYVEWIPDRGVAEITVRTTRNAELIRYRWLASRPNEIIVSLDHGGRILPGIEQSLLRKISLNLTHHMQRAIGRAGGPNRITPAMLPQAWRNSFPSATRLPPGATRNVNTRRPSGGEMAGVGILIFGVTQGIAREWEYSQSMSGRSPETKDAIDHIDAWARVGIPPARSRNIPVGFHPSLAFSYMLATPGPQLHQALSEMEVSEDMWIEIAEAVVRDDYANLERVSANLSGIQSNLYRGPVVDVTDEMRSVLPSPR